MSLHRAILLLVLPFAASACVGEASATYRGVVVSGPDARYTFQVLDGSNALSPIEGARVRLDAHLAGGDMDECAPSRTWPDHGPNIARTDANGAFNVSVVYGGMIYAKNVIVLCVDKEGYAPFVYHVVHGESPDPRHGEKPMTIVLAREDPSPHASSARAEQKK